MINQTPHTVKWMKTRKPEKVKDKKFPSFSQANGFATSLMKKGFQVRIIPHKGLVS